MFDTMQPVAVSGYTKLKEAFLRGLCAKQIATRMNAPRRRRSGQDVEPTLRDVARRAGVSIASASRALARPSLVSEEIQQKVRDAADALSYLPNAAARALSLSSAGLVGAMLPADTAPQILRALGAFENSMSAAGVGVLLTVAHDSRGPPACVRWLEDRGAAAIVLFGEAGGMGSLASMRRPWIRMDLGLERAVTLAARYLHDLGHRRIGLVGESGSVGGVQSPLDLPDLAGLKIDLQHFGDVREFGAARRISDQLVALRGDAPTALICGTDLAAVALRRALRMDGIDVPRQVSIVGVGDTGLATMILPGLTSVRIASEEAGATAARMALDLLEGRPHEPEPTGVKLVLRGSAAAPLMLAPRST